MRQIQAQSALEEIQQRRFLLGQQQRNDAANQNAATVFRNANPLGMDDASKEAAATAISQGRYDPSMWVGAATGLAKQRAADAASQAVATDPDVQNYTPAEQASVKSLVLNGTSLADAKSQVATERLTAAKTTGALGARDAAKSAAGMPGADPEAAALASSAALTDPTAAEKLIEAQRARIAAAAVPAGTLPSSPAVQEVTSRQLGAGQPVTPPAAVQPAQTAINVGADIAKAQAAPRPPSSVVAPTTFDTSTGAVNAPASPAGPAVTVPVQGPNTQATAATEGAQTQAHEVAAGDIKVLDQAISESGSAQAMKSKLSQLKDLTDALNTSGAGLTARALRTLASYNVHPGDIGATYAAIQQIINAEIPDVRQKAGIQRLAGPAIQEEQLILGTANMPRSTLMNIIANEEATADLQISRATLAYQARTGQIPMDEYYKQSLALDATIKDHTNELRNQYKAIGTERTRPADAPVSANPPVPVAPDGTQPAEVFDLKTRKLVPVR
jgi:hypothetical protein